jgi:hypothetical protein
MPTRPVILAVASEFKGVPLLREFAAQGAHVVLLMDDKLEHEPWPWDAVTEHFTMPDVQKAPDVLYAVSYLARDREFARVVALDDYDVEMAAELREHLRLPGLSASGARFFRDKLAMRTRAREAGIPVPEFTGIFNYDRLRDFMGSVSAPWMFKPRTLAGAEGIRKLHTSEELWRLLDQLGDQKSYYLLERFLPGDVYHVDALVWQGEVIFSLASRYGVPPMTAFHGRDIFTTRVLPQESAEAAELRALNERVVGAMGRESGPTHTEFIRDQNGEFYFLETAARVAGGSIDKLIEAATGVVMWQETARIELSELRGEPYAPPPQRAHYAGLIACFSRTPYPDTSHYGDPEIFDRPRAAEFASLIVGSPDEGRVEALLADYAARFRRDFM